MSVVPRSPGPIFKAPGNPEAYPIEEGDPRVKDISVGHDATITIPISSLDVKDSNPKDAVGIRKVPYSTLPTPVLAECGVAMLEGAIKYGRHNYRVIGVRASVYYDAVVARHLAAWWEGEDDDAESGISHISKAIAGLMVLRDAQIRGKMVDDRPVGTKGFIKELNKKVEAMMDRLPEPKDAFIANGQPQDEYTP